MRFFYVAKRQVSHTKLEFAKLLVLAPHSMNHQQCDRASGSGVKHRTVCGDPVKFKTAMTISTLLYKAEIDGWLGYYSCGLSQMLLVLEAVGSRPNNRIFTLGAKAITLLAYLTPSRGRQLLLALCNTPRAVPEIPNQRSCCRLREANFLFRTTHWRHSTLVLIFHH